MKIGIYEVLELLGDGGMGSVHRCRDPRFDRQVAVKVLHPHFQRNPDVVVRFKTEAVVQAKLSHPHIVSVYDFLADDETLAIVMELVEGDSAERLVEKGGPLEVERGLSLFEQVLDAIGYAHDRGLVHRDVKPSNILVRRTEGPEIAKVVDFGIAKIVGSDRQKTATTAKLGTLAYMSPEQVRSPKGADARSDVYSLGATLQQLLTGRLPFDGESDYEVMRAILEAEPAPPSIDGRKLPGRVERAIRKSLLRDPDQRFQSCAEFVAALRGAAVELPLTHPPSERPRPEPPPPPPTTKFHDRTLPPKPPPAPVVHRRPKVWALAAAVLGGVLLLGAGTAGWVAYQGFEERTAHAETNARLAEERAQEEARRLAAEAAERERSRQLAERREREEEERERREREAELREAEERARAQREDERRRVAAARQALEEAVRVASAEVARDELDAARRTLQAARDAVPRDLRADLDGSLGTVHERLLEIDRQILGRDSAARTEAALTAARRRVFSDQLALSRAHLAERRFPEAKSVAEQLLQAVDLPSDLREEAGAVVSAAEDGLRGGWQGARVGAATEHKKKPPPH